MFPGEIIGEQSRLRVVTESRGLLTACLRAEGRSGHSAYQWLGDNAILKLMSSLDKLLASYPVAAEEVWRTSVNIRFPAAYCSGLPGIKGGQHGPHEYVDTTTVAPYYRALTEFLTDLDSATPLHDRQ